MASLLHSALTSPGRHTTPFIRRRRCLFCRPSGSFCKRALSTRRSAEMASFCRTPAAPHHRPSRRSADWLRIVNHPAAPHHRPSHRSPNWLRIVNQPPATHHRPSHLSANWLRIVNQPAATLHRPSHRSPNWVRIVNQPTTLPNPQPPTSPCQQPKIHTVIIYETQYLPEFPNLVTNSAPQPTVINWCEGFSAHEFPSKALTKRALNIRPPTFPPACRSGHHPDRGRRLLRLHNPAASQPPRTANPEPSTATAPIPCCCCASRTTSIPWPSPCATCWIEASPIRSPPGTAQSGASAADLEDAMSREANLLARPPPDQRRYLTDSFRAVLGALDRIFDLADRARSDEARTRIRMSLQARARRR